MSKKTIILLGFILAKFLLQYLLVNPHYDLHRDEYLHLDQANHMAWGYLSVPPVTSGISYIILLLGGSIFWVKFFPAFFGAITLVVVWKTIEELKGSQYAMILGATCILLSALLRLNFLFQPNSLDVLCWTAFYFSVIRYFNREEVKWLYIAALIFAAGFLNKYNILFLVIGLLPAMIITSQRKVFKQKHFYYAIVFSLVLIWPNLYWQYCNNFPVLRHMKELSETQLIHVNRWDFIREQLFYFAGALPVIISGFLATFIYSEFKKYQFLFWSFLFTLITFIFFRAKGYYAIGLYPIYIAIGAAYLGRVLNIGRRRHLRIVLLMIPILLYVLLYKIFYTIEDPSKVLSTRNTYQKLGLLRWEDGKDHLLPQDFADMLGWKELAGKVEKEYNKLPPGSETFILCDNYGQAGAINYYAKNKRIRAVSFNADYINWFNLDRKIRNFIRVKEYAGSYDEFKKTSPYFSRAFVADSVCDKLAREYKTSIFVFMNAEVDVNERLKSELESRK
jgi:hypothetical protein